MDPSFTDPNTEETNDSLKGTTSTYPADESVDRPPEERTDKSPEELIDNSYEDRVDETTTPQWRRLTVTLSASGVDSLPEMTISATHPTYGVSELPVNDAGNCTLWIPETVDVLNFVLSFIETNQDDVSLTDIAVSEQDTITIPIVVLTQ